jgi:hypothetical protein
MKQGLITNTLLLMALCLAMGSTASASTTRYVNGVTGSDSNNCLSPTTACKTIGHAISLSLSGDSIRVSAATYKENLDIDFNLRILGSSAATTIIDGGGNYFSTVVTIPKSGTHVTLSKVTIRNGKTPYYGGGIYNSGTLLVIDSTLSGNTVSNTCPSICPAFGGGIYNIGALTINKTTLSENLASATDWRAVGGGIYNVGTLTINNSTISGNSVSVGDGGGIFNGGTATINNSTISGNTARCSSRCGGAAGGGISNDGTLAINNSTLTGNSAKGIGGSIYTYSEGTAILQNTIVANSPSGGNCGGSVSSKGYNLSSDATCNFTSTGDLNNTDPMLGPLQYNGGPTQTMALPSGSPAVDAGNPSGCTDGLGHLLTTDQRGKPRHDTEDSGGCDMGAYERQSD